jgi:hypothetical protein
MTRGTSYFNVLPTGKPFTAAQKRAFHAELERERQEAETSQTTGNAEPESADASEDWARDFVSRQKAPTTRATQRESDLSSHV